PSTSAQDTVPTTPRAETGLGWPAIAHAGHPAGPPRFHGPPQPAPPHQPDASLASPSQSALPAPPAPPRPTRVSSVIPVAPVAPSPIVPGQSPPPGLTGFPQAVDNPAVHLPPRALTPEVDQAQRAFSGIADLSTGQTEPPTGQQAALVNPSVAPPGWPGQHPGQPASPPMPPTTPHQPAPSPETWTPSAPAASAGSPSAPRQSAPASPAPPVPPAAPAPNSSWLEPVPIPSTGPA